MPLVQQDYTIKEACDLIAERFPGEDPWSELNEALCVPFPHGKLSSYIICDKSGKRWEIEAEEWRAKQDLQYDRELSRGKLRKRGFIEPVTVTGEIRIGKSKLDDFLASTANRDSKASLEANGAAPAGLRAVGGRPRKWDWEAMWCEALRLQYEEGLPGSRAALKDHLQQWFVNQTGEHPSDTEMKKRVSKIFQTLHLGEN
jgi:hypothetical protein